MDVLFRRSSTLFLTINLKNCYAPEMGTNGDFITRYGIWKRQTSNEMYKDAIPKRAKHLFLNSYKLKLETSFNVLQHTHTQIAGSLSSTIREIKLKCGN